MPITCRWLALPLGLLFLLGTTAWAGDIPSLIKWSQPPEPLPEQYQGYPVYNGWDAVSIWPDLPIVADDWLCETAVPVTCIHWWGSYVAWMEPQAPQAPDAFWFGIYTDVPAGVDLDWSHPGDLIWEYETTVYDEEFQGYDCDPFGSVYDAMFQYNVCLPECVWFEQEEADTIYWVSIAAVYADPPELYPWGWKTRPHFWNDDAVTLCVFDNTWREITGPENESWDLAFELGTCIPEPGCLTGLAAGLLATVGFAVRRRK